MLSVDEAVCVCVRVRIVLGTMGHRQTEGTLREGI